MLENLYFVDNTADKKKLCKIWFLGSRNYCEPHIKIRAVWVLEIFLNFYLPKSNNAFSKEVLWSVPGFESRPEASPQCGLRGSRSHCNTV